MILIMTILIIIISVDDKLAWQYHLYKKQLGLMCSQGYQWVLVINYGCFLGVFTKFRTDAKFYKLSTYIRVCGNRK